MRDEAGHLIGGEQQAHQPGLFEVTQVDADWSVAGGRGAALVALDADTLTRLQPKGRGSTLYYIK